MAHRDGTWRNVEAVLSDLRDRPAIAGYVANLRDTTERKQVESLLAHQALHDPLTGLANRTLLLDRAEQMLVRSRRAYQPVAALFIDVDNFKEINDTFGHEAGDQLIIKFGNALKAALRNSDFIARLGGDEFCVLFPYTPLDRAQELAERLRASMPESVELIPGVTQKLSWSGGLSEYSRDDHGENEALARADAALLEAKRGGRNVTRVRVVA
jgi:diguanylate cyclase (GGDEF)-like protein